jgi:hypothetical protein
MSSNVKDTIREALDIASQLAGIAGDWNLDEVEINGEMIAIYEVNDVFVAALAALAEPQPTIPPDVRETLRGALLIVDQSGINKKRILAALSWLDAQQGGRNG